MLYDLINNKQFMLKLKRILLKYSVPFTAYSALALTILLTESLPEMDKVNPNYFEIINKLNLSQNLQINLSSVELAQKTKFGITMGSDSLTNDAKIGIILEQYNLTKEQFDIITAIVLAESKANSYEDAYCVINTIFNRTNSEKWSSWVSNIFGNGLGNNLYYQVICPSQFVVYDSGIYLNYMNASGLPGYQAVIDFLYTKEKKHNYLSFVANGSDDSDKVQLVENGNLYYNELTEEDAIDKQKIKVI